MNRNFNAVYSMNASSWRKDFHRLHHVPLTFTLKNVITHKEVIEFLSEFHVAVEHESCDVLDSDNIGHIAWCALSIQVCANMGRCRGTVARTLGKSINIFYSQERHVENSCRTREKED